MVVQINKERALEILLEESEGSESGEVDESWAKAIEEFSEECESSSKTHIAFLGTAILAKATNIKADAFSVKTGAGTAGAYSARGLGHGVLVPNAVRLGISLGVDGREPLNNQPYFRIKRATRDVILPLVKENAVAAVEIMCQLLEKVDSVSSGAEARAALRAFIYVRKKYERTYANPVTRGGHASLKDLAQMIHRLSSEQSEGGKRAQACAFGIMALFAGYERTRSGRINEPDKHMPGDVGVVSLFEASKWERVVEVRDKPVNEGDLLIFCKKAAENGVTKAAMLAVSNRQPRFAIDEAVKWAEEKAGVMLTVFWEWEEFLRQAFFWSSRPEAQVSVAVYQLIRRELFEIKASDKAIKSWDDDWEKRAIRPTRTNYAK